MMMRAFLAATVCAFATSTTAQNFDLDTDYTTGMATLGLDLLIDAPAGTPVYIGAYELCRKDGDLFALGFARVQGGNVPIGLIEATRQNDGTVTIIIPDTPDPYGEDFFADLGELGEEYAAEFAEEFEGIDPLYEDDRLITLWTLLQGIPCGDWGDLTADPATLLPVASIDGATSMSALIDTFVEAE